MPETNPRDILPNLPCTLPETGIPADTNIRKIAGFSDLFRTDLTPASFTQDAVWRDTFALTGTLRTFYSAPTICDVFNRLRASREAHAFRVTIDAAKPVCLSAECGWIDVPFVFQTRSCPVTDCSGVVSLVRAADEEYRVWMLCTMLEGLHGRANVDSLCPGVQSIHEIRCTENMDVECLVVGAGHSGLGTAGRLKALGVSCIVIERNARVGDNWRRRYDSLRLHTIRNWSHLPFERTFPPSCGEWLTKDQLAEGLESWSQRFGINVWTTTELESGIWDEMKRKWTLRLQQYGDDQRPSRRLSVTCSHVVLATGGPALTPRKPRFLGEDIFKGEILHSANYKNGQKWKGKRGVVIGSANTGHDMAKDLVASGASSVTMVQRSTTYVLPREYLQRAWEGMFNDATPTEVSDREMNLVPTAVARLITMAAVHPQAAAEPERFQDLVRAGFRVEVFGDLIYQLNQRLGGHSMDTGSSAMIARGEIKVKSDSPIVSYTEEGLLFEDGSVLPADVVIFATGFTGNLRDSVRTFFGEDVYDRVEDYWGIDPEAELKGVYVPMGHPGLWYMGGGMGQARFYSRFVALQIRASLDGTPLPVYRGIHLKENSASSANSHLS
ncbi:putative flavin-containing monooxygenase [Aspergillus japonicus CBS 114.51]|uniref:Putative flavin-containing monooxygenase n=2 Tax=Aspergillus TaxID=5052 RepID=A0A2V5IBC2_ASPV1|nr:putative flavin-containing monooxygenase [Aspergillus japonicus CBS 114.51]PYI21317.1 putative flavin-containing monooxygenase [Aspergillus violaceofuscus CBS 115571]RAH85404.1 putative flavin-containing monooxygenase [Aspergillus japonicus CBS 114.51]